MDLFYAMDLKSVEFLFKVPTMELHHLDDSGLALLDDNNIQYDNNMTTGTTSACVPVACQIGPPRHSSSIGSDGGYPVVSGP